MLLVFVTGVEIGCKMLVPIASFCRMIMRQVKKVIFLGVKLYNSH